MATPASRWAAWVVVAGAAVVLRVGVAAGERREVADIADGLRDMPRRP